MSLDAVKYEIRKNKVLSAVLKPVYRAFNKVKKYGVCHRELNELDIRLKSLSEKKHIWYFCVPVHKNLGDQAQKLCILKWMSENYPEYDVVQITTNSMSCGRSSINCVKKYVGKDDLIFFQSGYTFDGYHIDEAVHKSICENFDNKIIFLPQTILYKTKRKQDEMVNAINNHKRTLLLARDQISYETASRLFDKITVQKYPDIVTSMIGTIPRNEDRDGILFCIRNDREKLYSDKQIDELIKQFKDIKTDRTDTNVVSDEAVKDANKLQEELSKTIEKYSKYKLVITDRYHGTIISLIAGTPVIILKTTDHKVTSGADWFKGVCDEYVSVVDNLESVYEEAEKMLSRQYTDIEPYFEDMYYKHLKETINEID